MYGAIGQSRLHVLPYVNYVNRDPMRPTHMRTRKEYLNQVAYQQ